MSSARTLQAIARGLVGVPFEDGARGPASFDCWGLVREVYALCGISLPPYPVPCDQAAQIAAAVDQELARRQFVQPCWEQIGAAEPLAVALFRVRLDQTATHVGVCIDAARVLHTTRTTGAAVIKLAHPFWVKRIVGFYRWIR